MQTIKILVSLSAQKIIKYIVVVKIELQQKYPFEHYKLLLSGSGEFHYDSAVPQPHVPVMSDESRIQFMKKDLF